MKKTTLPLIGLFSILAAASASASDICDVPKAEWQPKEALHATLVEQGWTIKNIKVDDGCYEAYATTDTGKRIEAYFNPKTFELVKTK